jgi:protein PsiE
MQQTLEIVEKVFLLIIALFTILAMGQEIRDIILNVRVDLKDLLLMFIYAEVIGMLGAYYVSSTIPIELPLFIAITALARLIILGDKESGDGLVLVYEGGAMVLIALAGVLIRYRHKT